MQDTSCLKKVENLEDEFMEVESVTSVSILPPEELVPFLAACEMELI